MKLILFLLIIFYISCSATPRHPLYYDLDLGSSKTISGTDTIALNGLSFSDGTSMTGSYWISSTQGIYNSNYADANGNVGINTTNPNYIFHLTNKSGNTETRFAVENFEPGGSSIAQLIGSPTGAQGFYFGEAGDTEAGGVLYLNQGIAGVDLMIFQVDGNNALNVGPNGNVGIGFTGFGVFQEAPTRLTVTGTISATNLTSGDAISTTTLYASSYVSSPLLYGTLVDLPDHNSLSNIQGGTTDEYYHLTASEHASISADYTSYLLNGSIWTSASNNVYTQPSGNVGVGVSSPAAKLEVSGTISATTSTISGSSFVASGLLFSGLNDFVQGNIVLYGNTTQDGGRVQMYSAGDSDTDVNVYTLAPFDTSLRMNAVGSTKTMTNDFSVTKAHFNSSGEDIDFQVETSADTNSLFVNGFSGNVGINTNAPTSNLHVVGSSSTGVNYAGDASLTIDTGTSGQSSTLTMVTANNGFSEITFGKTSNPYYAGFYADASAQTMTFWGNDADSWTVDQTGDLTVHEDLIIDNITASRILHLDSSQTVSHTNFTADGQLIIGSSTGGYTLANLTTSGGISIANGPGTINISYDTTEDPRAVIDEDWLSRVENGDYEWLKVTSSGDSSLQLVDLSHPGTIVFTLSTVSGYSAKRMAIDTFGFGSVEYIITSNIYIEALSNGSDDFAIFSGMGDTPTNINGQANAVGLLYDINTSANWLCYSCAGSTCTTTSTGVAAATGWNRLKTRVNAAGSSVDCWVDNTGNTAFSSSPDVSVTTNIPTGTSQVVGPIIGTEKLLGSNNVSAANDYFRVLINNDTER